MTTDSAGSASYDLTHPVPFSTSTLYIWYDWDHDEAIYANWGDIDSAGDYDSYVQLDMVLAVTDCTLALNPLYSAYYYRWVLVTGGITYDDYGVIINNKSTFLVENTEPMPVRLAEIGPVSNQATITGAVPVSLEASVSVDGTLPVDPWTGTGVEPEFYGTLGVLGLFLCGFVMAIGAMEVRRGR